MSQLTQLIEKVKEEGLSKDLLEQYHTQITYLDNLMRMELAPLEKEEALFMGGEFSKFISPHQKELPSVAQLKVWWKSTASGQRQIELNHYLKITPKLLQSIKTRLYSIY